MKVVPKPVGKGDARRPKNISDDEFTRRWMMAFTRCPRCGASSAHLPYGEECMRDRRVAQEGERC